MNRIETPLSGLVLIEPRVFGDARGYFYESWNKKRYRDIGLRDDFVQDNVSLSAHGILRGLHFQNPNPQGKLVFVLKGTVFDVAVDIRLGSPTFGESFCVELSEDNHRQLFMPPGFAHGFCVLSDSAIFMYKCTDFYNPHAEFSLAWNDPDLAIPWPIKDPTLSDKDGKAFPLKELPQENLLPYV